MEILIGLALGVALLYLWLAGHWFGRVLMFLLLAGIIGGLLCVAVTPADLDGAANPLGFIGFIVGTVIAWFVSGIPAYKRRRQIKVASAGCSSLSVPAARPFGLPPLPRSG